MLSFTDGPDEAKALESELLALGADGGLNQAPREPKEPFVDPLTGRYM